MIYMKYKIAVSLEPRDKSEDSSKVREAKFVLYNLLQIITPM